MINNFFNDLQSKYLLWGLFSYDTLLTVLVTLFVSFSLLLIKELIEKCIRTKNLRNISKYFIHSINDLIDPISLEINLLNTVSQNIINSDNSDFIFRQNHKLSIDNIKNICQFDIYKYFILRKPNQLKNKYFSDIQNSIVEGNHNSPLKWLQGN